MENLIIIFLYSIIGVLFQIINVQDKKDSSLGCIVSGIVCGFLSGTLITEHKVSTLILGGIIIGFLISGRLNNIGYYFSLATVLTMTLYFGAPPISLGFFLIIAGALMADEILSMDNNDSVIGQILWYHPFINVILVLFFIFDIIPSLGVVAFIISEITYRLGAIIFEK